MSVYDVVKGRVYPLAQIVSGRSNGDARREGFRDVYDMIMSDSDHARQQHFLMQLPQHLPEGHRQILLDGLAKEYAEVEGWLAYVERENRMTLNDLRAQLIALAPGKAAGIHHDIFADLFPPGEPDERAREACFAFAAENGCHIDNRPAEETVWFIKKDE